MNHPALLPARGIPGMSPLNVAHLRGEFAKWVQETDVAAECGLTREELIDLVEFRKLQSDGIADEVGPRIQAALGDWVKLGRERMRRLLIDGEMVTVGGRFIDPESIDMSDDTKHDTRTVRPKSFTAPPESGSIPVEADCNASDDFERAVAEVKRVLQVNREEEARKRRFDEWWDKQAGPALRETLGFPSKPEDGLLEAADYKARYMMLASGESTERLERVAKAAKTLAVSALEMARTSAYSFPECLYVIDEALAVSLKRKLGDRGLVE